MELSGSATAEINDKGTDGYANATTPVGSFEKSSEISGEIYGKYEESFNFDSDDSDLDLFYACKLCKKKFSGIKPLRQHERSGKHLKTLSKIKLQKEMEEETNTKDSNEEDTLFENRTYAECSVCKKEFNGIEAYQQHLKSIKHRKKESFKKLLDQAKEDGKVNVKKLNHLIEQQEKTRRSRVSAADSDEDDDINADDLNCPDCEKVFTGLESFYEHMKSKAHKKIIKQNELISKLITGTTSEDINGIEVNGEDIVCRLCKLSFTGPENVTAHVKSRGHSKMQEKLNQKKALKERKKLEKSQEDTSEQEVKTGEMNKSTQLSTENMEESRQNTLLCYNKYKNYKEIMKEAQSTQIE